ncbi:MAG: hypothetical protein ABEI52_10480, partial [Halobacteriaceae archaeon]
VIPAEKRAQIHQKMRFNGMVMLVGWSVATALRQFSGHFRLRVTVGAIAFYVGVLAALLVVLYPLYGEWRYGTP